MVGKMSNNNNNETETPAQAMPCIAKSELSNQNKVGNNQNFSAP